MTRYFLTALICAGLFSAPAAAQIKYYPDPVYKKLNADDPHPMDDMLEIAKQGDVRAQFIIGDMYAKGKGGFGKDLKEARKWFEESAMHGYGQSFIRLAALAKRDGNTQEAWQWYTLAIETFDDDAAHKFAIKARHDLTESAQFSPEDLSEARRSMRAWQDKRREQLRAERTAELEKERLKKEQDKADAKKKEETEKEKPQDKQPPQPEKHNE